jgi:hypothetical protein
MDMKLSKLQLAFMLFCVFPFASCAVKHEPRASTVVLSYQELGPQAAVYELIGKEWYQWNNHGGSDPNEVDDVKVVVYRNVSLEKVKEIYPVVVGKQDYRYLDYETAIKYLNKNEGEPYLEHLQATKQKVIEQLGS